MGCLIGIVPAYFVGIWVNRKSFRETTGRERRAVWERAADLEGIWEGNETGTQLDYNCKYCGCIHNGGLATSRGRSPSAAAAMKAQSWPGRPRYGVSGSGKQACGLASALAARSRGNSANLCWAGPYDSRRSEWRGVPRGAAALFDNFWKGLAISLRLDVRKCPVSSRIVKTNPRGTFRNTECRTIAARDVRECPKKSGFVRSKGRIGKTNPRGTFPNPE